MRKNFPNIAFLLMLFSTIVFADVHPVLKEAIDKKNYTQAEKIVKNTGLKDVYCPSTLSAKEAKKIYGKLFADSVALLMKNCDMEFAISYLDYDCAGGKNKTACLNLVNLTDPNLWPQNFSTQFCTKKNVEICAAAIERVPIEKAVPFLQKIKTNKLAELKKEKGITIRVGGETKDECIRSCEWGKKFEIAKLEDDIIESKQKIRLGLSSYDYNMRDIRSREREIAEVSSKNCSRECVGVQTQPTMKNFTEYYFGEAFAIMSQKIAQYYMDWKNPVIYGLAENWSDLDKVVEKMKDVDAEILKSATNHSVSLNTTSMIEKKYERFPNFITKKIVLDTLKSSFSRNKKIDPLEQLLYCKIYPSIEKNAEKEFGVKFVDCKNLLKDNAKIVVPCEDGSSLFSGRAVCENGEYAKNYSVSRKGEYVVMQENLFNQIPNENVWCPTSGFINCMRKGPLYTWTAGMQACPKGWKIPNEKEMENILRNVPLKRMSMSGLKSKGNTTVNGYGERSCYMTSNASVGFSVDSTGAWKSWQAYENTMLSILCIKENVENEKCSEIGQCFENYCCDNGKLKKFADFKKCNQTNEGEFFAGKVCSKGAWRKPTEIESVTNKYCGLSNQGEFVDRYVCDDEKWREISFEESYTKKLCTESNQGMFVDKYVCDKHRWRNVSDEERITGAICDHNVNDRVFVGEYICKNDSWTKVSRIESELKRDCSEYNEGEFFKGYVCEFSNWRILTEAERVTQKRCSEANSGEMNSGYICLHSIWRIQTDAERATQKICSEKNRGEVKSGYVCDKVAGAVAWRTASDGEKATKKTCSSKNEREKINGWICAKDAGWIKDRGFGKLVDSRDGKEYRTIKIGKQEWMAENLRFRGGGYGVRTERYIDPIQMKQNVCPSGWVIPSEKDWKSLFKFIGGVEVGEHYKSVKNKLLSKNEGGLDEYGFNALKTEYDGIPCHFAFWTSTKSKSKQPERNFFVIGKENMDEVYFGIYNYNENAKVDIRCIKE